MWEDSDGIHFAHLTDARRVMSGMKWRSQTLFFPYKNLDFFSSKIRIRGWKIFDSSGVVTNIFLIFSRSNGSYMVEISSEGLVSLLLTPPCQIAIYLQKREEERYLIKIFTFFLFLFPSRLRVRRKKNKKEKGRGRITNFPCIYTFGKGGDFFINRSRIARIFHILMQASSHSVESRNVSLVAKWF